MLSPLTRQLRAWRTSDRVVVATLEPALHNWSGPVGTPRARKEGSTVTHVRASGGWPVDEVVYGGGCVRVTSGKGRKQLIHRLGHYPRLFFALALLSSLVGYSTFGTSVAPAAAAPEQGV